MRDSLHQVIVNVAFVLHDFPLSLTRQIYHVLGSFRSGHNFVRSSRRYSVFSVSQTCEIIIIIISSIADAAVSDLDVTLISEKKRKIDNATSEGLRHNLQPQALGVNHMQTR